MIKVGLSTISVFPKGVEDGFRLAHEAGYDGVEVMVTTDAKTRSPERLLELSRRHGLWLLADVPDAPLLISEEPNQLFTLGVRIFHCQRDEVPRVVPVE